LSWAGRSDIECRAPDGAGAAWWDRPSVHFKEESINVFKKCTGLVLLPLLLVAGSASAELKIAVIDTQRALLESEEAQQLMQTAQTDLEGRIRTSCNTLGQEIHEAA
jgi:hypothetical protein